VRRGYLGVGLQELTPQIARINKIPDAQGVVIKDTLGSASPALRAGLQSGDVIVSINGQKVTDQGQIDRVVTQAKIGSTVKLGVVKWNGRSVTLTVPVVARQDQLPAARRTM
jgi:serine protease Do